MARRLKWEKIDKENTYIARSKDSALGSKPKYLYAWHETRSCGAIRTFNGLKLLVVKDRFDPTKWVFYRYPPNHRAGKVVRSSSNFDTKEQAINASMDFSQEVIQWDIITASENDTTKIRAAYYK